MGAFWGVLGPNSRHAAPYAVRTKRSRKDHKISMEISHLFPQLLSEHIALYVAQWEW